MPRRRWTNAEIEEWIEAQTGPDYWYQRIPVREGIVTPGTVDSLRRLSLLALPDDLSGKSVLDIGCNSGMLCFESKKRNADRVVGIDLQRNRLEQARTLAEIMELDIEFIELDLFRAVELGQFDVVFCIAVLTEVTDLITALGGLKDIAREVLYIELATMETFPRALRVLGINTNALLDLNLRTILGHLCPRRLRSSLTGRARLRRIDTRKMLGWSLIPDRRFLNSIIGDQFEISDLGMSARYNLFKAKRKESLKVTPGLKRSV